MGLRGCHKVLERRTTAERIRERRKVVLLDVGVTPRTQSLYYHGARRLLPIVEEATSDEHLDRLLCAWIQRQWEKGATLHKINMSLCGLQYYLPSLKKKLFGSWKLFQTWRKIEVPSRAPPFPSQILFSVANFALARDDLFFSALLALAFTALLRTGEMLKVTPQDLLLKDGQGLLRLANTKTALRKGTVEVVPFDHPWTYEVVNAAVETATSLGRQHLPLWTQSGQSFRQRFKAYMKIFQLQHCGFRPYSLRRGGATDLFLRCKSYDIALQLGRWESTRVARLYIQEGLSQLPLLSLPEETKAFIREWFPWWSSRL